MNKLIVDKDKYLDKEEAVLEETESNLVVEHSLIAHQITDRLSFQTITCKQNSTFLFYQVILVHHDIHIKIELEQNSTITYHLVLLNKGKNKVTIENNMNDSNTKANIYVRAINQTRNSELQIICDGNIKEGTVGNELLEDLKGFIRAYDKIEILPNMFVNTNEVLANHLVTIGSFKEEEIFYLESRGLSEESAKELLLQSFLISNMTEYEKKVLKLEVNEFE